MRPKGHYESASSLKEVMSRLNQTGNLRSGSQHQNHGLSCVALANRAEVKRHQKRAQFILRTDCGVGMYCRSKRFIKHHAIDRATVNYCRDLHPCQLGQRDAFTGGHSCTIFYDSHTNVTPGSHWFGSERHCEAPVTASRKFAVFNLERPAGNRAHSRCFRNAEGQTIHVRRVFCCLFIKCFGIT